MTMKKRIVKKTQTNTNKHDHMPVPGACVSRGYPVQGSSVGSMPMKAGWLIRRGITRRQARRKHFALMSRKAMAIRPGVVHDQRMITEEVDEEGGEEEDIHGSCCETPGSAASA